MPSGFREFSLQLIRAERPDFRQTSEPVDMQHSRTPYLQLTNLEEGMYRFQLKVADAAGQSSTAQVDVFVRHPAVAEPRGKIIQRLSMFWNVPECAVAMIDVCFSGRRIGPGHQHSGQLGPFGRFQKC